MVSCMYNFGRLDCLGGTLLSIISKQLTNLLESIFVADFIPFAGGSVEVQKAAGWVNA